MKFNVGKQPGVAIIGFNIDYDGNVMKLASVINGKIFDDTDIINGNLQKKSIYVYLYEQFRKASEFKVIYSGRYCKYVLFSKRCIY